MQSYGNGIVSEEKPNGGVATGLIAGNEVMQYSHFSFLSHDNLNYSDKLSQQVDFFRDQTAGKVIEFSHEHRIEAAGRVLEKARPYSFDRDRMYYELLFRRFIIGCSLLVPHGGEGLCLCLLPDHLGKVADQ